MRRESAFQSDLIRDLKVLFPGSVILKTDANYIQGFPDILILYKDRWASLECKRSEHSSHQPNQDYYVEKLNGMSYSAFIFPENKEEILYELQQALGD